MLVMSAAEDAEVERWRSDHGRCRLPDHETPHPKQTLEEAISKLPPLMSIFLNLRLKAGGVLGALALEGDEVAEIEKAIKRSRLEIMSLLLPVASALSVGVDVPEQIGAVAESLSGGLYIGAPVVWKGAGVKFGVHGVQSAVLNAWQHGEVQITRVMTETTPCACCRQFLRETWSWGKVKLVSSRGKIEARDGVFRETLPTSDGLNLTNVKGRLLGEPRRGIDTAGLGNDSLALSAAEAAAYSYAPYSRNYAGIIIRAKNDARYCGRYVETGASVAGVMAVEAAIVQMIHCGGKIADIGEIVLVETRGTVTQFSSTQKLAAAMGKLPFRFMMVA